MTINKSKLAKSILEFLGFEKFPCLFHQHLIWLVPSSWPGLRSNYEEDVVKAMHQHLLPACWFVDLGAHFGLWTLYADRLWKGKRPILAVEPSPAFETLVKNTSGRKRISIEKMAVSDQIKTMKFFSQGTATSGSLLQAITKINEGHQTGVPIKEDTIRCSTLDEITKTFSGRGLVKIDCEGHEYKILKGAIENLRKGTAFVVEIHHRQLKEEGDSPEKVYQLFADHGYTVKTLPSRDTTIFTVVASLPQK
jgi:FkbM family methyltransferase